MELLKYPNADLLDLVLQRPSEGADTQLQQVREILDAVKKNGDSAVLDFTEKFDGVKQESLRASGDELESAEARISDDLKSAIRLAIKNISAFHRSQIQQEAVVETMPGVRCWRKSVAIERVGLYIPGGSAPLFSTILMLAIPAKLAGCRDIILCTPPGKDRGIHPAILFACKETGIQNIFRCGGAQAIAAMAYGTESITRVDKIFGPGNSWVTKAKMLVNSDGIAIDMPAGPSEVLVVADATTRAPYAAADLLSQAEHGPDSQVLLISTDENKAREILGEVRRQVAKLPRKSLAEKALTNSKAIVVKSMEEAMAVSNRYAPEHLILSVDNASALQASVINAGSVFLGHYAPESAGDYASGTNHTLPTNGYARAYSGVSLDSFIRKITFQEITPDGLKGIGPAIEIMAEAEELEAHKRAVSIRLNPSMPEDV